MTGRITRTGELAAVCALLLLAAALRTGVALRNPLPAGDGVASELEMAGNILDGEGFSTARKWILSDPSTAALRPEGNRQPAMSVLVALAFGLFGRGFGPAAATALATGLFAMLAAWWWARAALGRAAALAGLAWLALDPVFIWFSTQPDSLMLFTGLFFCALALAGTGSVPVRRAVVLGLVSGAAWLARTQGLFLSLSMACVLLLRGGSGRTAKTVLFLLSAGIVMLPWMLRNTDAFGSPLHTQNGQFLLNENHWAAWEVRSEPPRPTDILENQGPLAVAGFLGRGVLRVLEPLTTGTMHRGERFAWPPMILFLSLSALLLSDGGRRRVMLPALAAGLPMVLALVLHEHAGRYLAFMVAIVVFTGAAGAIRLVGTCGWGRTGGVLLAAALLLPLARPLAQVLSQDSRERAAEAAVAAAWLRTHSNPGDWVVTFPNVELLIWEYDRPTLTMPNDYEMLLWPCLERHGVRFVVVDPDLPPMRPWLSTRWRMSPDGAGWETADPPPFLREVFRSVSGRTIIYEWIGEVPEGFMAVESLPPDNRRALPPAI